MQRDRTRPFVLNHFSRVQVGGVSAVAFWGQGKINAGLRQGQKTFRHADKFHGLLAGYGQRQGLGVGQADIFSGGENQAAADKTRVFASFQQAGQVIQGRVRIAPSDGFDQSGGDFIVAVAIFVMAQNEIGQGVLDLFCPALVFGHGGYIFQQVEQGARVPIGGQGQQFQRGFFQFKIFGRESSPGQLQQFVRGQRPQAQHMQAG